MLIGANSDVLTNRPLIEASLKALVDGHYLQSPAGAIGTIDPAKMEAIGDYLFKAEILRDGDGNPVSERPDFAAYYSNAYLADQK